MNAYRIPAEWEPQGAVLVAWPHAGTDWAPRLPEAQATFTQLVKTLAAEIPVILLVPAQSNAAEIHRLFADTACPVYLQPVDYNDTWLRDSLFLSALYAGPEHTSQQTKNHRWLALDFPFTGWGGKFDAQLDNRLNRQLLEQWQMLAHWSPKDFELEGGSVDFDGKGSLLTTTTCLQKRHPLPLPELETRLKQELGVKRILWLHHGGIEGDDTDSHVDMLARFAGSDQLVFQSCDERDYPLFDDLRAMAKELQALRQANGEPYRLHALPWPAPVFDESGHRLPASYANFLICNQRILMPEYACPQDSQARDVLQRAFPDHRVVGVPCRTLIWQNGSLHCSTMHVPKTVFQDIQPKLASHEKN